MLLSRRGGGGRIYDNECRSAEMLTTSRPEVHLFPPNLGGSARILHLVQPISSVRHMAQLN